MKSLHYNTLGCDEMVSYFEGKLAHDFVMCIFRFIKTCLRHSKPTELQTSLYPCMLRGSILSILGFPKSLRVGPSDLDFPSKKNWNSRDNSSI